MRALLCPGQGVHSADAIVEIRESDFFRKWAPVVNEIAAEDIFAETKLARSEHLRRNEIASLLTVFCTLYWAEVFKKKGAGFTAVAGYSVGQWSACWLAGLCDMETLFEIVWRRSQFMNQTRAVESGRMLAVLGLETKVVDNLCREIADNRGYIGISNYNCPGNLTIAGEAYLVTKIAPLLSNLGAHKVVPMENVAGAWHCPMLEPATHAFAEYLNGITLRPPKVPIIDNVTGTFLPTEPKAQKQALAVQISAAVQWETGIRTLLDFGVDEFLEVGFGSMLSRMGLFITRKCRFLDVGRWQTADLR